MLLKIKIYKMFIMIIIFYFLKKLVFKNFLMLLKYMDLATNQQHKKTPFLHCILCDFKCCKNSEWNRHVITAKHQKLHFSNNLATFPELRKNVCSICNKEYKDRTGLWRHKKKCLYEKETSIFIGEKTPEKTPHEISSGFSDKQIIKLLIQENSEFKNLILELIKKDTVNITNNTNNTNSHNKTFNLQVYLHEDCKDALNISDFVSSIKVELDDLETTGRLGYVEGVSRIINKNLNDLDANKRPIHCSDLKREVLYIKNDDQWTKEDDSRPILKKVIKQVANENIKKIGEWRQKYPDCTHSDSRKNDMYLNIVSNSMSGLTTEEQSKNVDKIISNVAKESVIDK
jgi:hypothetical protein